MSTVAILKAGTALLADSGTLCSFSSPFTSLKNFFAF